MTYYDLENKINCMETISADQNDKLSYAIARNNALAKEHYIRLSQFIEDINTELASLDERGNLIVLSNHFQYTPVNKKELNKKIREFKEQEISFSPHMCKDLSRIDTLPYSVLIELNGFLFEKADL